MIRIRTLRVFLLLLSLLLFTSCVVRKSENKLTVDKTVKDDEATFLYAFTEATRLTLLGSYVSAEQLYKQCLKINPYNASVFYQLGKISFIKGDYKNALHYMRLAEQYEPENVWFAKHLADIYESFKMRDSVIAVYERMVQHNPDDIETQLALADMYVANKNYEKAINNLEEIIKKYGPAKETLQLLAELYKIVKQYYKAVEQYELLLMMFPNDAIIRINLAETYSAMDSIDAAKKIFDSLMVNNSEMFEVKLSYAGFLRKMKQIDKSFTLYYEIIDNNNIDERIKTSLLQEIVFDNQIKTDAPQKVHDFIYYATDKIKESSHLNAILTDYFVRIDSLSTAAYYLQKLIVKQPRNEVLWDQKIYIYSKLNEKDSLYQAAKDAYLYFPDKREYIYYYGITAATLKKADEAVEMLNKCLLHYPEKDIQYLIYYFLAESYRDLSLHKESDMAFEKAIKIDPNKMTAKNNYSYYLSLRGENLKRAKKLSKKTLKAEPTTDSYLDTYGWILYAMGKYRKAAVYLEKALHNGGYESAIILEHYGDVMLKLNKKEDALTYYQKAAELNDDENIDRVLEKIKTLLQIHPVNRK